MVSQNEIEFLRQSNAIEGVYSDAALERAIKAWEWLILRDNMSGQVVRYVHKLLAPDGLTEREVGKYRNVPVYIGGHEAIHCSEIPMRIRSWSLDMNKTDGFMIKKESWAKRLHVEYEKIHPFIDGNGRTGRMFMNWHRVKKLGLPILTINAGPEQFEYYKWFA